jgi:methylmalonyl-CoA mutase cobalamin-binding domain/chain
MADLQEDVVLEEVRALKAKGVPPADIIDAVQQGMAIVGQRFEEKEYYLSELIMSAEIFNAVRPLLDLGAAGPSRHGKVVIGTIYQDVHDIGKNIVSTVLASHGFDVVDIGVDVPAERFVDAVRAHKPRVLGISCLLTTCFANVRNCIAAVEAAGLRDGLTIVVGGGPVDETAGRFMGADAVCRDAMAAVALCARA